MEFKKLLELVLIKLKDNVESDPSLKGLSQSVNETELRSVLRDRIFRTDDKTNEFILSITCCQDANSTKSVPKRTEMSEQIFSEFLFDSIKKNLSDKKSKFKLVSHYFTTEKDIVVKISDSNDYVSEYRIMTIKSL